MLLPTGSTSRSRPASKQPLLVATSSRRLGTALAASLALGLALSFPAHAEIALNGTYENNPTPPGNGNGFETTAPGETYAVGSSASFSHNKFVGLYDDFLTASIIVNGGTFASNGDGIQAITSGAQSVTIHGGLFTGNESSGVDVYGAPLTVTGGTFSNNVSFGLEIHSPTLITGGSFISNGRIAIAANDATSVFGGTFVGNPLDFSAADSVIRVFGQFDKSGVLTGSGNFTGTLANGGGMQTFSYVTSGTGELILPAVPEPSTVALLAAGLGVLGWRQRARLKRQPVPLRASSS